MILIKFRILSAFSYQSVWAALFLRDHIPTEYYPGGILSYLINLSINNMYVLNKMEYLDKILRERKYLSPPLFLQMLSFPSLFFFSFLNDVTWHNVTNCKVSGIIQKTNFSTLLKFILMWRPLLMDLFYASNIQLFYSACTTIHRDK